MTPPKDVTPSEALTLSHLPLFPLQTVLFPGGWMPLRIFEVRYLDMIRKCHKVGAPFGVVGMSAGSEVRKVDHEAGINEGGFAAEAFYPVGTLAHIEQLEAPQSGLLMVHCRGSQRFEIQSQRQLPHGLWMADVTLLPAEPNVAVPEHLISTRDALERLLHNLLEREPEGRNELPLQEPYRWNDSGWVANRWLELLPADTELKQRLMSLDSPIVRLELVSDLLDHMGVAR